MPNKPMKTKNKPFNREVYAARNLTGLGWDATEVSPTTPPVNALGIAPNPSGSTYVAPQEQAQIQGYFENPKQVAATEGPVQAATGFLASVFDYTDTQDNPVEWAWDGVWRGLGWGYDKINHSAAWTISAAPGGIDTFTWDQANEISVGQASLAAGATSTNNPLGNQINAILNPVGAVLGATNSAGPLGQEGFDVTDPNQRKAAFEDSTVGRWASGLTDAAFVTVADPLLFAGKVAKIAKLKYLDDMFQGVGGQARLDTQMAESLGKAPAEMAPVARVAYESTVVDATTGQKTMSRATLMNRFKGASDGAVFLVDALYHNTDEETAQLLIKYAFGNKSAGLALLKKNPDIAMEVFRRQRREVQNVLDRSPETVANLLKLTERSIKRLDKKLADPKLKTDTPDIYNNISNAKDRAQKTYDALYNNRIDELDDVSDPRLLNLLSGEFKAIVSKDQKLAKFIIDEENSLKVGQTVVRGRNIAAGGNYGFARNTALGRAIEGSRLARAETGAASAASRSALRKTGEMKTITDDAGVSSQIEKMKYLRPWQVNEFNQNGFTRAVNVWRWMGEHNPSGYIRTKGAGASDSWKEMQAVINDLNIYHGQSRRVTFNLPDSRGNVVSVTKEIGGKSRGEELLNLYMDALHDSTAGSNAAAVAVKKIEELIWNDISQWHGISKTASDTLRQRTLGARDNLISNFQKSDTAFWVENGKLQKAPWIESQIQNGTYLPNFRKYNKIARLQDESGLLKTLDSGEQFIGQNASNLYNAFNEVWRPSVLLRLGYTIRNNAEGLFRASAYAFSLDPIRFAAAQAAYAPRNAYVHFRFPGAMKAAESAVRLRKLNNGSTPLPKRFSKWLEKEINARETQIENTMEWIKQPGNIIADVNVETKTFMEGFYKDVEDFYAQKLVKAKAAGADSKEIAGYQNNIDNAIAERTRISQITEFQRGGYELKKSNIENIRMRGNRPASEEYKASKIDELKSANDELLSATIDSLENLSLMRIVLKDSIERRAALDDDISALSAFRQQGAAKLRVMNGTIEAPGKTVLMAAFNEDNPLLSVILSNLSADATTKAMSVSSSNTMKNAFLIHRLKTYVNVQPGAPEYFNGLASVLRQISFSEIGKQAIAGKNADEIAAYLVKDDEGRQILEFIINGWNQEGGLTRTSGMAYTGTREDALQVATTLIDRYKSLAPSPELQIYMKTFIAGKQDDLENVAKNMLTVKDSSGKNLYDLKPVVGNISEEYGAKTALQFINQFTSAGMKWLGTYPEDAITRAPFYGMRYKKTLLEMIETRQAGLPIGDAKITMREYNDLMGQAHLRALKDTKQWMFTIDRRTNLGTYGEVAIPFISALQNSVTTVGRLLWRDPAVAVLMTRLWQLPTRAGITDEQGNICIPIPHDWLPDGVEQVLGIENQLNMKIGMSQLNLIASQLDTGVFFQLGPVVATPAAEIMRHGLFGVSPDAPSQLVSMLGKDNADSIWDTLKTVTFGGYRNAQGDMQIANPPNALESILPPWAKRTIQLFEKEGNATYARTYNANYHSEYMKWRGGLRPNPPQKDEILNMTNNLTIIQLLTNLTAAFPPRYENNLQPLVDDYRNMLNSALSKDDADRMFTEKYGSDFLSSAQLGMSSNLTGIGNNPVKSTDSSAMGIVAQAQKYSDLVSKVSPILKNNNALDSLSILFTTNANDIYDGTVTAWQESNAVPGLSEMYKSSISPEEAFQKDAKNAGWSKWISAKSQFDARLAQQGFTSYSQAPALQQEKNAFLTQMANDPMYQGWFISYNDFSSQRTEGTVLTMKAALADPTFVADHMDDPVWQAASEYLNARAQVENQLAAQGGAIDSSQNTNVAQWWDTFRSNLMNVPGWDVFANRYLDGDNDPTNTGISIVPTMSGAA